MPEPARSVLVAAGLLAASSCAPEVPLHSFEFTLRVLSDPDEPLADASVRHAGDELGRSDEQGVVRVRARGKEGERLALDVTCPDGYRSPEAPLTVTLHQARGGAAPEFEAQCPPLRRRLVVAVRAEQGANLPVRYLGHELARTDASGAALVLLESFTDDTLELTLDTSEQPRLVPKSPPARFRMPERDDIAVMNQKFELSPRVRAQRVIPPKGPVRIQ